MKRFFELQFGMKRDEVFIEALNDYPDQLLKIGEFTPKEPFTMKRSEGKKFFDVIRFQDVFNFAISSRLYNILREEKITGWNAYRIKIKDYDEEYCGFQVIGKSGNIFRPKEKGDCHSEKKFNFRSYRTL